MFRKIKRKIADKEVQRLVTERIRKNKVIFIRESAPDNKFRGTNNDGKALLIEKEILMEKYGMSVLFWEVYGASRQFGFTRTLVKQAVENDSVVFVVNGLQQNYFTQHMSELVSNTIMKRNLFKTIFKKWSGTGYF